MIVNQTIFNCTLEEVLDELEIQLKANGIDYLSKRKDTPDNIMVCCPYHKEKNPSAGIHKETGIFHCFACGEIHSLDEVITYCFGKNDPLGKFGYNWLRKNFGSVQVEVRKDVEIDLARPNISDKGNILDNNSNTQHSFVTEEELGKYRYIHPYMYQRKLTDEIIELFDIGYDKDTECITFPVRDKYGNCLFVARRSVKTKYFNYPQGVEKPLYGLYELYNWGEYNVAMNVDSIGEIIVCESMLDALTAWVYGEYAVALNGLGTELQFKQLKALPWRKLILATDNDTAGEKARKHIRQNVDGKLITEYVLPRGKKDLNELTYDEFIGLEEVF